MNSEQRYILALSFIKGLGDYRIKKLIQHFGSAENVWNLSKKDLLSATGIGPKLIQDIGNNNFLALADQEIDFCLKHQIDILPFSVPNYPSLLKECEDAPVILFTKGTIDFESRTKIAIVGTRKMTAYGRMFIDELIDGLKEFNVTIVSGLAYGCDIHAQMLALNYKMETWAVLAHHLNHLYPPKHKYFADQMLEKGGWISEQASINGVHPQYFLQRNRIIAGLSHAVILVESNSHGGSLVTAKFANDYNRDVFALPGRSNDPMSKGCNYLIKSHQAYLLENANDLLYHFNLKQHTQQSNQIELFQDLTDEEAKIVEYLAQNGKVHVDALSLYLNCFTYELMPILLDLELKNCIKPLPGKYFEVIR